VYPFDDETCKQFNDIVRYWEFAAPSTNELELVACRLYGICINAAAVERLWSSSIAWEHSRKSNPVEIFPPDFEDENETINNDQPNIQLNEESSNNDKVPETDEFVEPAEPDEFAESDESAEHDESADLALNENYDDKTSLEEFGQFLDVWVEVSTSEIEEITHTYNENMIITSKVEDI
ncbi:27575_t:CDS:2, partial [Racocetra persica]